MPFDYYYQLSAPDKTIYRQSDAYDSVELEAPRHLETDLEVLQHALIADRPGMVNEACNLISSKICQQLNVEEVVVAVEDCRPADDYSDLHGLYEPGDEETYATITVWMRTSQRKQIVAFRTFLRTLLHELCHHLDYELLELEDSFHTEGFFMRETSLFKQLLNEVAEG